MSELKTKKHPRNPNSHPKDQIVMLSGIMEKTGWRAPIVVSTLSGLITRGHGRLESADYLKLKECPVDFQDYKDDAEEIADMIADNKLSNMSIMDNKKSFDLMYEISMTRPDFPLSRAGFTEIEIDHFSPRANPLPRVLQSKIPEISNATGQQSSPPKKPARDRGRPSFKCPQCGFEDMD